MYLFHDVIHMRSISAATMRLACLIAPDFVLFPFLSLSLSLPRKLNSLNQVT